MLSVYGLSRFYLFNTLSYFVQVVSDLWKGYFLNTSSWVENTKLSEICTPQLEEDDTSHSLPFFLYIPL